jgi:PAS domain S-box-containing protein
MFLMHMATAAYLGARLPVIAMLLPVIVAAMFGGVFVGIAITLIGGALSVGLLASAFGWPPVDQLRIAFFVIEGSLVSWLVGSRSHALRAQEAAARQLRRAIAEAPLPLLLHAENGEILEVSRSVLELTGYRQDELRTLRDWTRLAYGSRAPQVRAEIEGLYAADQRVDEGEYSVRTATGEERLWHFWAAPLGSEATGGA